MRTSEGDTARALELGLAGRAFLGQFQPAAGGTACVRSGGDGSKQFELFREDFQLMARTLDELRQPLPADGPGTTAAGEPAAGEEQLELF